MIAFIIGAMVGSSVGFFTAAMLTVSKSGNQKED